MRHTTEKITEYGRFSDPSNDRQYVVTSSLSSGTVRVWAVERGSELEPVCTIYNVSLVPLASWDARWIGGMWHWRHWLVERAAETYRTHRARTAPAEVRET